MPIIYKEMKKEYVQYNRFRSLAFFAALLLFLASCHRDSHQRLPSVRAIAAAKEAGGPADRQEVEQVVFYIFDQNRLFIDKITAPLNQSVELDYPCFKHFYVIGLGNIDENNGSITGFEAGMSKLDGEVTLKLLHEYLLHPLYASPSDIFYGEVKVRNSRVSGLPADLPLARATSNVSVKVRGVKEHFGDSGNNYSVVLSTGYNALDFSGMPMGCPANYRLAGEFTPHYPSQFETGVFRVFGSRTGIPVEVRIYRGNTLVDVVSTDISGNPLMACNGKLLEVRINYTASTPVVEQIHADWNDILVWKGFD